MSKKKDKPISRRSFLSDTGKTLLYGTLATAAIPTFLQSCKKDENCDVLKEGENGAHFCDTYYLCTDSRGFTCPTTGDFLCGTKLFGCYTVFACTPSTKFYCQKGSAYYNDKGGAGS